VQTQHSSYALQLCCSVSDIFVSMHAYIKQNADTAQLVRPAQSRQLKLPVHFLPDPAPWASLPERHKNDAAPALSSQGWVREGLDGGIKFEQKFEPLRAVLQCVAVWCCSVLHCVAVSCSVLRCVAVCCSMLSLSPSRANVLMPWKLRMQVIWRIRLCHDPTHCNSLQQ